MTVSVYHASFTDISGKRFYGSIYSDKYTPTRLDATICPHISASEVDYPIWTAHAANNRSGLAILAKKMKSEAAGLHLTFVSEEETKFAHSL